MRILIIRLSAIGDTVMSSALLRPLRARYPDARLYLLTGEFGTELLAHHPLLTAVWTVPQGALSRALGEGRYGRAARIAARTLRQIREVRFDLVVDCQGLLKSALWARFARARRRVVLNPREGTRYLFAERVVEPAPYGGPVCREYRTLARYLELPEEAFGMSLQPSARALSRARERFPEAGRPRVFFFPFTTRPQKHWPADYWRALGEVLERRLGAQIVVLGGPGDAAAAHQLAVAIAGAEAVAGPASDLDEKMACISRADLCIGVDTGLTHMALAFEVPTIAIFGSTCPYEDLGSLRGRVFFDRLPCAPCRRHPTCGGRFDCLTAITVERVAAAAIDLAGDLPPQGA